MNKSFYSRRADIVARKLLGKIIVRKIGKKELRAKIVETEAYFDHRDPASRARFKGDLRDTMAMSAGTILIFCVHNNWLFNIVTGNEGEAEAVLIRAVEPLNFEGNTKGPGLSCRAMKIDKSFHKGDIRKDRRIGIEEGEEIRNTVESFRIGVKKDLKEKYRFHINGNKFVSKR